MNKNRTFISKPLLKQSIKSNWMLWLMLTLGATGLFVVINLLVGSKPIFTNIDMDEVSTYVKDENMSWLKILGLLESMGFSLTRIQAMSQIDMNSIFSDLIYKVAGILLPMIYVILVSNKLIASQVNDGSMAYILSTPTNRKTVIRTQFSFMVVSLVLMYAAITVGTYVAGTIGYFVAGQSLRLFGAFTIKTILFCLASFAAMFALMGICFGASAYFNKSSQSIAVGGGFCVFSFLTEILGIFGSTVFVSVGVGVPAMGVFNYVTILSLIDTDSITELAKAVGSSNQLSVSCFAWAWKIAILIVVGLVIAYIGSKKFIKKDLPL